MLNWQTKCKGVRTITQNNFLKMQLRMLQEKSKNPSITWENITDFRARHYQNMESSTTVRKGYKLLAEYLHNGWTLTPPSESGSGKSVQINKDNTETSVRELEVLDEKLLYDEVYLLKAHGYDPSCFSLVSARSSQWDSGSKHLCSSSITVKAKSFTPIEEDLSEWMHKLSEKESCQIDYSGNTEYLHGDKLLVLPISDLHFNMQATPFSSGNSYDCDTAETICRKVVADVLSRTANYQFCQIVFLVGGDMLNSDNVSGTTAHGTPQDNCLPYYDACNRLYDLMVQIIEVVAKLAPVRVIYVPGNHDTVTGFKLAKYIEAWFRNTDRVYVDTSPLLRKYFQFGKTLFMFAHDADVKKIPQIVAVEQRQAWSDVEQCEVMLQHLHSEQVLLEDHHMRIQRLPTVCAKSAWTTQQGYVSMRQCKSFVYDKSKGLTDVLYTLIKD